MGRKCKCKACGKELRTDESFYIIKNDKKQYYCSQKEYDEYITEKEKEKYSWIELYNFVKNDVLGYDSVKQLPRFLITRLQDLRNGTTTQPTIGRIKQEKLGYKYEIILETFKECLDDIKFWGGKKTFKTEKTRINYIMTIIENHISNIYDRKKYEEKSQNNQINDIDLLNINLDTNTYKNKEKNKPTLIDLLDEGDLD